MTDISVQEIKQIIDDHKPIVILDVRTPEELTRGKIPGAINIPVDEIENQVESAIPDKDTTVYVYCLSASRSPRAVEKMEQLGYTHVYNIAHGLLAWRIAQFPIE